MLIMEQAKTEYLTVDQIADELDVAKTTVREWIQEKKLVAYKLGRNWKIKRVDLEKFIEGTRNI